MELTNLLQQVALHMRSAKPAEIFRMAMLLCHEPTALETQSGEDVDELDQRIRELSLQLALQEDQYAAIADDLDSLASTEPCQFSVQHLWTLIRAIKVQSQLLNLYLGPQEAASGSPLQLNSK